MCMSELPDWTEEGAIKRANCWELKDAIECMEEALNSGSCGEYGGGGLNDFLGEMKEERNVKCNVSDECYENEEFQTCGTACFLTCFNYNNPPEFCTAQCVIGCACKKGFVRTIDGRCVRPEQCEYHIRKCVENEEFQMCGTPCPLTCDNYQNPPEICPVMCKIGCACKKGFVSASDGRCVRPEQCQAPAPGSYGEESECNQNAEMCIALFAGGVLEVNSESKLCRELTTAISCLEEAFEPCGENDNRLKRLLDEMKAVKATKCSFDLNLPEVEKCYREHQAYILECYRHTVQEALERLEKDDEDLVDDVKCGLFLLPLKCGVRRIQEMCGIEVARQAVSHVMDVATDDIRESCSKTFGVSLQPGDFLQEKKKK